MFTAFTIPSQKSCCGRHLITICKREKDAVALLFYSRKAVSEMNLALIKPAGKRVQQVRTMKRIIRSAILLRNLVPVAELQKLGEGVGTVTRPTQPRS